MKKIVKLLTLILALTLALCFTACGKNPDIVAIKANSSEYQIEDKTLIEFMEILSEDGKLTYTFSDGMITSVNGVENGLSSFWMIYTDDAENSNSSWGFIEYKGKEYYSAMFGAGELPVKDGATYILAYQTF